jgi:ubiquinone/menaquinone biosynthesis C-methylase UbiE
MARQRGARAVSQVASNQGWQSYWHEDRLAACTPDDPAAAAVIEAQWCEFFSRLDAGMRVLDVATGNGVLLVWAARAAMEHGRKLDCVGVDLADIDPATFLPRYRDALADTRFIGGTPAEALPFDDASFDVLVSQYGLEYADLDAGLSEAARVLKPGGTLRWLAHSGDSAIVAQGQAQLREIRMLLAQGGPFACMQAFVEAQVSGVRQKRATRDLTEALREAEAYCHEHPGAQLLRQLCAGILDTANNLARYRPDDVTRWLEENRRRLKAQQQRVSDLQAARLDAGRLRRVRERLGGGDWHSLEVRSLESEQGGMALGILLEAVRA